MFIFKTKKTLKKIFSSGLKISLFFARKVLNGGNIQGKTKCFNKYARSKFVLKENIRLVEDNAGFLIHNYQNTSHIQNSFFASDFAEKTHISEGRKI